MLTEVVAGAMFDTHGRVLIAQRPAGKSSAGRWEFPGGKREPGESLTEALRRELAEELGVEIETGGCEAMLQLDHGEADRIIRLHFFKILRWQGDIRACEGQTLQWLMPSALSDFDILDADQPFIEMLQGVT